MTLTLDRHRQTRPDPAVDSDRVARLLASEPPPLDLRRIRAEVAAMLGVELVVRAWTGERG